MTLGFTDSGFYVNSASGIAPDNLERNGMNLTDARGMVPLEQVVSEANAQGVPVTVQGIAGTLVVGRVAHRWELERLTGRGKRQANRIMARERVEETAPLTIAAQPAYTMDQMETLADRYKRQARRNMDRSRTDSDANSRPFK